MMAATSGVLKHMAFRRFLDVHAKNRVANDFFLQKSSFSLAAQLLKPRKRSQWRQDRQPANTQLATDAEEALEKRRTYGGSAKTKAISKNKGKYLLKSQGIELEVPILDVVHSDANRTHVVNKIMTKGTIVQLDGTDFKQRLEGISEELKNKDIKLTTKDVSSTDGNPESLDEQFTDEINEIDKSLLENLNSGKLYGKITTRPGQVGLCDGYILEGAELQRMIERLSTLNAQS